MNLRRIRILRRKSWLGKLIRLPFALIPSQAVLPIVSGPPKKFKWIKGSHNISILLGTYEKKQTGTFLKAASGVSVFWDLGAHAGYYSLLFHKASPKGKIFAFEPLAATVSIFNKHMSINHVVNYTIFTEAVSDKEGILRFNKTSSTVAGKLDDQGETEVKVVKLSGYLSEGILKVPQLIKMDIEGAEFEVLQDLKALLKANKPTLFLSTHGKEVHDKCIAFLKDIGYELTPLDADNLSASREVLAK